MITRRTKKAIGAIGYGSAITTAALLGSLFMAQPAMAQGSGTITVDVERCFELESVAARRACIGAQVDEVLEERGSVEPDSPSPQDRQVEAETSSERALPVQPRIEPRIEPRTEARIEPRAAERPEEPESWQEEYFGTIVAMRERLPSAYVIRLDNGEIWEQTEPKQYPLKPGLEVRIYSTRWGGRYRLSGVGSGGHIQVRRVQ